MYPNDAVNLVRLSLPERILEALHERSNQKAIELAQALGVERREINRCLSHTLAGKVVQNAAYRWSVRGNRISVSSAPSSHARPLTDLGRLSRYYLDCIGNDSAREISVFAASLYGAPEYAELSALPMPGSDWEWWNAPGVERVLRQVRADRTNLVAWLGYPVRLREHRTPRWSGFFVEPVMLWPIEIPEARGEGYRLADELPAPNFSVLKSMAMGDPSAAVEEAARLDEELALNNLGDERPDVDEVMERLVSIRPDWDWRELILPEAFSEGSPLSAINETGIYNRAIIVPGKRSPFTQGLEVELKKLADIDDAAINTTILGRWLSRKFEESGKSDGPP